MVEALDRQFTLLISSFVVERERAALFRGLNALFVGVECEVLGGLAHEVEAFLAVVGYPELEEGIGEAHHPDAYPSGQLCVVVYLGEWEPVDVDCVVEVFGDFLDDVGVLVPVKVGLADLIVLHELCDVYAGQVAGFVLVEGLFTAWVGGPYLLTLCRLQNVSPIYHVKEHHAGVCLGPGHEGELFEEALRIDLLDLLAGSWVNEWVALALFKGLPEVLPEADAYVEVAEHVGSDVFLLGVDELFNVRVPDLQDAHVGSAPDAALLDDVADGVDEVHEGHGAACCPCGGSD